MGRYSGALHGFGAPQGALFPVLFPASITLFCPDFLY